MSKASFCRFSKKCLSSSSTNHEVSRRMVSFVEICQKLGLYMNALYILVSLFSWFYQSLDLHHRSCFRFIPTSPSCNQSLVFSADATAISLSQTAPCKESGFPSLRNQAHLELMSLEAQNGNLAPPFDLHLKLLWTLILTDCSRASERGEKGDKIPGIQGARAT